jgi:hypothetical protein
MRNEMLIPHTMVVSPTTTLFLFQIARLMGGEISTSSKIWPERESMKTYMRSMITSEDKAKVEYEKISKKVKIRCQTFDWSSWEDSILTKLKVIQTLGR